MLGEVGASDRQQSASTSGPSLMSHMVRLSSWIHSMYATLACQMPVMEREGKVDTMMVRFVHTRCTTCSDLEIFRCQLIFQRYTVFFRQEYGVRRTLGCGVRVRG